MIVAIRLISTLFGGVLTVIALAKLRTFNTKLEALAILLQAIAASAVTAFVVGFLLVINAFIRHFCLLFKVKQMKNSESLILYFTLSILDSNAV